MQFLETTLSIGVQTPFSILHMSDTHMTRADARDGERKCTLAQNRFPMFPDAEAMLTASIEAVAMTHLPLIHTGDLIDFVSEPNLEAAKEWSRQTSCFFAAGNHEFSLYVGEAFEDAAYRNQSLAHVQQSFGNDIRFSCRTIGGVNFVAIDNSYYRIEEGQLAALKQVAKEDAPIVLVLHTPLYTPELYERAVGGDSALLMNVPEEKMRHYNDYRYRQQRADAVTEEAFDWIMDCDRIRGVLAGHLHMDLEFELKPGIMQILTGCTTIRRVRVE